MNGTLYEKQSKKDRRALDLSRRGTWNGICPVTRVARNKKRYYHPNVKRETRRLISA